jgi:hypothetical protein
MVTRVGSAGNGSLGTEYKVLEVNSDNVIMSAFYPEKGNIFARMYEFKGLAGEAQIVLSSVTADLTEVDLMGQPENAVSNPLSFTPWQIRTVQLGNIAGIRPSKNIDLNSASKDLIIRIASNIFVIPEKYAGKTSLITVYDLSGRIRKNAVVKKRIIDLDKDLGLPEGVYIVHLRLW